MIRSAERILGISNNAISKSYFLEV